ncbi:MAG: phosphatase PAP2 family protein, partial [Chitinophagaceae bacterium]|nr:phosphatase PAP2 family protein [Rubrivivax sp.]
MWSAYANRDDFFGGGISAMPSIHVAVSATMAFAAYSLNRRLGHIVAVFATLIWIGSVHLAWHYALDGVVGALMAYGIWRMSGALVDRFVFTESR